jgi:hypothetical protein
MFKIAIKSFFILPFCLIVGVWLIITLRTVESKGTSQVELRQFPYPYRAALTLTSDIDSTHTVQEFLAIQEFLNTKNHTPLGEGVGLEIGNSFFPTALPGRFAFMSDNPFDRKVIVDLNRRGYIDFIHSFGEVTEREEIRRVLTEMGNAGIRTDLWINHSNVNSDLGPFSYAKGDDPDSEQRHSDFSLDTLGVTFVWLLDVSSIIGQDRPLEFDDFFAIYQHQHPISSLYNGTLKEFCKFLLAPFWSKYRQRWSNSLLYATALDDGRPVFAIARADISHKGIGPDATAPGLAQSLRPEVLDELIGNGGTMIVYTHLGKNDGPPYLTPQTVESLRLLNEHNSSGAIFVTTSSRLLNYVVNRDYLVYEFVPDGGGLKIYIKAISDPVRGRFIPTVDQLQGITFYVDNPQSTKVFLQGNLLEEVVVNPPDTAGRASISIPWRKLEPLDSLMRDYKAQGIF